MMILKKPGMYAMPDNYSYPGVLRRLRMSKIDELKEAWQGYLAARSAIAKTEPRMVAIDIFYEVDDENNPGQKRKIYPGSVGYNPAVDEIVIEDSQHRKVLFTSIVAHDLIEALKRLAE
jgi:hypothetical protein